MSWYSNWTRAQRLAITVPSGTTAALSYFPVLLTAACLPSELTSGAYGAANGADLAFAADASGSIGANPLRGGLGVLWRQSLRGNLGAGAAVAAAGTTTYLWVLYGNSAQTSQPAVNSSYGSQAVWNEGGLQHFQGVYHLPNGSTLSAADSTGQNSGNTSATTGTAASGKIDGGARPAPRQQVGIDLGTGISVNGAFTLEAWVNLTSNSITNFVNGLVNKGLYASDGNGDCAICILGNPEAATGTGLFCVSCYTSSAQYHLWDSVSAPTGSWTHIIGTWDGSNLRLYKNGSQVGSGVTTSGTMTNSTTKHFLIGSYPGSGATNTGLAGTADEVRITTGIARNASWIAACYSNQSSPGGFVATNGSPMQLIYAASGSIGLAKATAAGTLSATRPAFWVNGSPVAAKPRAAGTIAIAAPVFAAYGAIAPARAAVSGGMGADGSEFLGGRGALPRRGWLWPVRSGNRSPPPAPRGPFRYRVPSCTVRSGTFHRFSTPPVRSAFARTWRLGRRNRPPHSVGGATVLPRIRPAGALVAANPKSVAGTLTMDRPRAVGTIGIMSPGGSSIAAYYQQLLAQ